MVQGMFSYMQMVVVVGNDAVVGDVIAQRESLSSPVIDIMRSTFTL